MKYATLILGVVLLLASIIMARAEVLNCDGVIINPHYFQCAECGREVIISNLPRKEHNLRPFDLRIKSTPNGLEATLNGKRCYVPE